MTLRGARAVTRVALARGFSTPIGVARRPDGKIIFNAWGQGAAYVIEARVEREGDEEPAAPAVKSGNSTEAAW